MYGNNINAPKLFRLRVPLFKTEDPAGASGLGNVKYFFPDTPVLDKSIIVGIEAHVSTQGGEYGDITRYEDGKQNVTKIQAKNIFITIYGDDKTQSFASIPLVSLFPNVASINKRVNPYFGKINTAMSYCILSNPTGSELQDKYFVNLTFYYHPKN